MNFTLTSLISGKTSYITALLVIAIIGISCKPQKDMLVSRDGKLKINKSTVIRDLNGIIDPDSDLTKNEKKALLSAIRDHGFQDPEIDSLSLVAEKSLSDDYTAANMIPEHEMTDTPEVKEEIANVSPEPVTSNTESTKVIQEKLNGRFTELASNVATKESEDFINETLDYFESSDAPVLIVLQKRGEKTYFDRPTTIEKYLYYLIDMKSLKHEIESVTLGENDKVNKLVLASK